MMAYALEELIPNPGQSVRAWSRCCSSGRRALEDLLRLHAFRFVEDDPVLLDRIADILGTRSASSPAWSTRRRSPQPPAATASGIPRRLTGSALMIRDGPRGQGYPGQPPDSRRTPAATPPFVRSAAIGETAGICSSADVRACLGPPRQETAGDPRSDARLLRASGVFRVVVLELTPTPARRRVPPAPFLVDDHLHRLHPDAFIS